MRFITYKELNSDILNNIYKIPRDVDVVVGVPRSGVMLASIIALYLNKPIVDLDGFLSGRLSSCGFTKNREGIVESFEQISKVLVVEDTVDSGRSMIITKDKLEKLNLNVEYIFLAGYVKRNSEDLVDIKFDCIEDERVFEWNYLHNSLLKKACVDIDGVLCEDPTNEENDDGEKYINFLKTAKIKLKPTRRIGYLVTSRLEKYRPETEYWLDKNGIQYDHLIMMNLSSALERQKLGNHAEFKANQFKNIKNASWFIESNDEQAREISLRTKKLVYCVNSQICYKEGEIRELKNKIRLDYLRPLKKEINKFIHKVIDND